MICKKRISGTSILVVLTIIITSAFAGASVGSHRTAPRFKIGQWMTKNPPDIKALDGRVYVVDFWATWCGPCVKGIGELNEINAKYEKFGLVFLSLCQDKSPKAIRKIIDKKKVNFNVAIDMGTIDGYAVDSYPTVAVVDHKGRIAWQGRPWDKNFEKAIRSALDAGPPPLLRDVELGPFKHHWKSLFGGKKFAAAYYDIKSNIKGKDNALAAKRIIDAIDSRVASEIKKADRYSKTDPAVACRIYEGVFAKYSGIEIVNQSAGEYAKLQKRIGK